MEGRKTWVEVIMYRIQMLVKFFHQSLLLYSVHAQECILFGTIFSSLIMQACLASEKQRIIRYYLDTHSTLYLS